MKVQFLILLLGLLVASSESKFVRQTKITTQGGKIIQRVVSKGGDDDENAPEVKDIFEINKDNNDLEDGDIVPSKNRNTLVDESRLWASTDIPVTYAPSLTLEAIASIHFARQEYEMRTCLSFVDRTNEKGYIYFDTLSGCYSSVGSVGSKQTISIGNGCERIGTVQHEMMHAIGIYHEQSRTDRDNYVVIELDNVQSGKEGNFNSYSYSIVDDRRVPYDFNSVMHYSDTSFSDNGEPTIVTIDPAYQDVIGQRRAFSMGDVTKINRMYKCGDTRRVSYNCNFEDESVCGYIQDTADSVDWSRYDIAQAVDPPTYLPTTDGTSGKEGKGSYMLFDSNPQSSAVSGTMYSMRFKSTVAEQCLEFSYHMKLGTDSKASINVHIATIDSITGDILDLGNPITTLSDNHEYDWNVERLSINAPSEYKLVFVANKEALSKDIIAIDDVSVLDKPCETGYFVINDFSELVAASTPGDYVYGPVMYTDDGYAYQIKVYPVGTTSSSDGYMALYYSVAMGDNDDTLQWPFSDRFIRLSVVDQGPDALTRMSQSNNFVSTSTSSAWEKPTTSHNGAYGYSSFMPVSEITDTRDFMKHDSLMISVQVTDMSSYASSRSKPATYKAIDEDMMLDFHGIEEEDDGSQVSTSLGVTIIAASSASVFLLMVVVLLILNERNSKQLDRAFI